MLNKLRKRLILLYTCSTGIILAVVLILVLVIADQQIKQNNMETFQNNDMTVTQKVILNDEISNLWLAEMEVKHHLIIHIEDCGHALFYKGSWKPITDRGKLVEKLKEKARKDNIHTDIRPVSTNEVRSRIYKLRGNYNDSYFGQIYMAATKDGYRCIIVLQYIPESFPASGKKSILIIILYLSGISELYIVSRWIVGKSLLPVEESRKRQTEFIAAASHELKSPLAVIRADTSALMLEPERAEYYVKGIDKECMRLSALVEDLLLLASADAKNWSIKKELVDMDLLLIDTYDSFQPFCTKNHKTLKLDLQEALLPKVEGDALRIKQILSILIDNAVSYSRDGDNIILRAFERKNRLFLEVEDHGAGIDPSIKKEVFERFYKGDKSRRDKSHFGLGLSIAKELTQLHGGSITIKETTGGGTTFSISLPIDK